MTKPILPFLETMITQVCNLSCEGCTNYSDLKHSGYVSWSQGCEWLERWLARIDIPDFGIMGGEPLINPECREWLMGVRALMPHSQIRFTTNALLLERNWDIIELMHDLGNVSFKITVHLHDLGIERCIEKMFDQFDWQPVNEYGIDRWITTNGFRFHVKRPGRFIKTFRNGYHDMAPWNSDPAKAFDRCVQQTCPLLHQGKIYKCSTAGLLKDVLDRYHNPNYLEWKKFLPQGLDPTCDKQKLQEFLANFGLAHVICGQCPDHDSQETRLDHKVKVYLK